jgi:hypothetical protein
MTVVVCDSAHGDKIKCGHVQVSCGTEFKSIPRENVQGFPEIANDVQLFFVHAGGCPSSNRGQA